MSTPSLLMYLSNLMTIDDLQFLMDLLNLDKQSINWERSVRNVCSQVIGKIQRHHLLPPMAIALAHMFPHVNVDDVPGIPEYQDWSISIGLSKGLIKFSKRELETICERVGCDVSLTYCVAYDAAHRIGQWAEDNDMALEVFETAQALDNTFYSNAAGPLDIALTKYRCKQAATSSRVFD